MSSLYPRVGVSAETSSALERSSPDSRVRSENGRKRVDHVVPFI